MDDRSEMCYKGTILQRNSRKMKSLSVLRAQAIG